MKTLDLRTFDYLPIHRADFLLGAIRLAMQNVPYRWGGKTPSTGLDCSGFLTHLLWQHSSSFLDCRQTHNTTRLWEELDTVPDAQPGDFAFYGAKSDRLVSHVMLCLGDGLVLGQAYGDQTSTDIAISVLKGRTTKALFTNYRADLVGFKRPRWAPPLVR